MDNIATQSSPPVDQKQAGLYLALITVANTRRNRMWLQSGSATEKRNREAGEKLLPQPVLKSKWNTAPDDPKRHLHSSFLLKYCNLWPCYIWHTLLVDKISLTCWRMGTRYVAHCSSTPSDLICTSCQCLLLLFKPSLSNKSEFPGRRKEVFCHAYLGFSLAPPCISQILTKEVVCKWKKKRKTGGLTSTWNSL